MPTKVLVSGFEPFGGSAVNPSQLLVEALVKEEFNGVLLDVIVLPVEFERSAQLLLKRIEIGRAHV